MASSPVAHEKVFIGPGLSRFKLIVTILALVCAVGVVLWIAFHEMQQGAMATAIGSTIAALVFIAGFAYYLRIIAPVPFTITLEPEALVKRNRSGEVIEIRWEELARIREEFFPNGTRIGVIAYRKITEPGQKAKAWSVTSSR